MDASPWLVEVLLQEEGRSVTTWLRVGAEALSRFAEAIAVLIIGIGIIRALLGWIASHIPGYDRTGDIRTGLGRSLILGLEFLLAADVLATAVAPTWDAIGKLAAIVGIRTVLDFYLEWELSREGKREGGT